MKTALLPSLLISALALLSACQTPPPVAWQKLTLEQSKPILVEVHDGDGVREHGEKVFFEAKLKDPAGQVTAQMLGMMVIVDLPGNDGVGDPAVEERFTWVSVIFPEGDEIVVQGANIYPAGQTIMKPQAAQTRAIVGGTGKFKGIRGQVVTTRNPDETYTHTLEYRLD